MLIVEIFTEAYRFRFQDQSLFSGTFFLQFLIYSSNRSIIEGRLVERVSDLLGELGSDTPDELGSDLFDNVYLVLRDAVQIAPFKVFILSIMALLLS